MSIHDIPRGAVVVGVDGSTGSTRALDWAATLAAREHRTLALLSSEEPVPLRYSEMGGPLALDVTALREASRQGISRLLDGARARVRSEHPGLEVVATSDDLDPREALEHASREAHLLVVGSRGHGRVASLLLGSVSASVARHGSCPVVVVRPPAEDADVAADGAPGTHEVVAAVDGTPASRVVVEHAYRLASETRRPLRVLHSWWPWSGGGDPWVDTVSSEDLRLVLAEVVAGLAEKFPDVDVVLEGETTRPTVEAILHASRGAHLVVVGRTDRHGIWGLLDHLDRSVALAVLERAHAPVMVVPAGA